MNWCPQAASHYLGKCSRSMWKYGVTRPQWVNNFLLFSQYCFRCHFTPQDPQLTCLSTHPLYSHQHICFLCHLLIFHNKKHHFSLLSSITKSLLKHTLASFWRKQSCIICITPFCVYIFLFVVTYLYVFISMAWRETAVAPVLTHCGVAAVLHLKNLGCSACMIWCVGAWFYLLYLHALFILQSDNSSWS